jgi:hypothetical protein
MLVRHAATRGGRGPFELQLMRFIGGAYHSSPLSCLILAKCLLHLAKSVCYDLLLVSREVSIAIGVILEDELR